MLLDLAVCSAVAVVEYSTELAYHSWRCSCAVGRLCCMGQAVQLSTSLLIVRNFAALDVQLYQFFKTIWSLFTASASYNYYDDAAAAVADEYDYFAAACDLFIIRPHNFAATLVDITRGARHYYNC